MLNGTATRGRGLLALTVVVVIVTTGCSGSSPGDGNAPEAGAPTPSNGGSAPSGSSGRSPFNASRVDLKLVPVADGLDSPIGIANAGDGSDLLYVVEQGGLVRIVEGRNVLEEPFLDVTALTLPGGERGLLGLAFHPEYKTNGRFFINYTDLRGDTVIAEYGRSATNDRRADPTSGRILIQITQPFANHNGGHLAFGPDGYLFIGMGDGGSGGDPMGNGQNLGTLLGKMLRIDVDETDGTQLYGIPPDNPYADGEEARPEIWASGMRNPWRFSFDRKNGRLWIGDVGQNEIEEVNRAPGSAAPLNYGWNVMEGDVCYETSGCDEDGLKLPLAVYSHDKGCSVTGGYVYRGRRFPSMQAGYFFSDYCSGIVWGVRSGARGPQEPIEMLASERSIASFGEDENGELYVTDVATGSVLRLADRNA